MIIQMKIGIWKLSLLRIWKTMKVAMTPAIENAHPNVPPPPILVWFFFSFFSHSQVGNAPGPRVPSWNLQHPLQAIRTHGNLPTTSSLASTHHSSFLVIRKQTQGTGFSSWGKLGTQEFQWDRSSPVSSINRCVCVCVWKRVCV